MCPGAPPDAIDATRQRPGTTSRRVHVASTASRDTMGHTQARRAQAVADEFETMRAIAKKEREVAKKLEAVRLETEARIAREAAVRDAERKRKVEEKLKKSQAILKEIERKGAASASSVTLNLRRCRRHGHMSPCPAGEESRLKAIEKEKRIQAILEVQARVSTVPSRHQTSRFGPRRGRAACQGESGRGDGVFTRPRRRDAVDAVASRLHRSHAGQEGQEEGGDPCSKREGREAHRGGARGEQRQAETQEGSLRREAGRGRYTASSGAFTAFKRLVSISRCRGSFLCRIRWSTRRRAARARRFCATILVMRRR